MAVEVRELVIRTTITKNPKHGQLSETQAKLNEQNLKKSLMSFCKKYIEDSIKKGLDR